MMITTTIIIIIIYKRGQAPFKTPKRGQCPLLAPCFFNFSIRKIENKKIKKFAPLGQGLIQSFFLIFFSKKRLRLIYKK